MEKDKPIKTAVLFAIIFLLFLMTVNHANASRCINQRCLININMNVITCINETVESQQFNYSFILPVEEGFISIPENIGYINFSNFNTSINNWVKAIVGVNGTISFNFTAETDLIGNFTTNSRDVPLNFSLWINGTRDSDSLEINIYLAIPKTVINLLGTDATDNLKAYVVHNDLTNNTYPLIRQNSLDSSRNYIFKLTLYEFSEIRLFYTPSVSTSPILGANGGVFTCTYYPNYNWNCSAWSECVNGSQTRNCKKVNNCGTTYGRPETERICNISQLFDIKLELQDATIEDSSELTSIITFTSFGTVPTPVNLTYVILNLSGKELYYEKENITVTTDQIATKSFENLNLPDGEYTLILITVYGNNVTDEFKQGFSVAKANTIIEKILDWINKNILKKINEWVSNENNLELALVTGGGVIFIILFLIVSRHKKKMKSSKFHHRRKKY